MPLEKLFGSGFIVGAWLVSIGIFTAWRIDAERLGRARARVRELESELERAKEALWVAEGCPTDGAEDIELYRVVRGGGGGEPHGESERGERVPF
jgi:hypothetical protein